MRAFVLGLLTELYGMQGLEGHVLLHHADLDDAQRAANVHNFTEGKVTPLIAIATSCFGTGIDAVGVSFTVCYGGAYSMLDLQQALGRAGREGTKATCLVLWHENHVSLLKRAGNGPALQDAATTTAGTLAFFQAVQKKRCLRQHLASILDGTQRHTCVGTGAELCSSCVHLTGPHEPLPSPQQSPISTAVGMSPSSPSLPPRQLFDCGDESVGLGNSNSFMDTAPASRQQRIRHVSFGAEETGRSPCS